MNSQHPVLVYVEDDENSIIVMKMVVERVMGLPKLHVLQSRTDFVQQVKELGGDFHIMGGDAMDNPKIIEIGGSAVDGFIHTTFPYDPNMKDMNGVAQKFTDNWRRRYPEKEPNVNAALGYDAYMIVIDAIKRAGKVDTNAITAALAATKGFVGVTGNTTINPTHDAEKPVGVVLIKNGKKTYKGSIIPEL